MSRSSSKNKKAYGLVEIVIVLGIISVVLIGAVSTMIRAAYQLRLNEVDDTANSLILKASEFLKSPSSINLRGYVGGGIVETNNKFNLYQDAQTGELFLESNTNEEIGECNVSNSYNVKNILGEEVKILANICMQIIIEESPSTNLLAPYSFTIVTNYKSGTQTLEKEYFGYRYGAISQ